jgi:hypothetical protein
MFPSDFINFRDKFVHILEMPIHRREADIRDLVDLVKLREHELAENRRRYLVRALSFHYGLVLDLVHDALYHHGRDRPLLERALDAMLEFRSVEGLTPAVPFNDHELLFLDALIAREPIAAPDAFPSAPDTVSIRERSRFDYFVVETAAMGTTHVNILYL